MFASSLGKNEMYKTCSNGVIWMQLLSQSQPTTIKVFYAHWAKYIPRYAVSAR